MKDVNKVILIGRLGANPEEKYTKDGKLYSSFSLATSRKKKIKVKESLIPEEDTFEYVDDTQWHKIVCWGGLAKIALDLFRKGNAAYVEGSVRASRVENPKGEIKFYYEVIAENLSLLERKSAVLEKVNEDTIPF